MPSRASAERCAPDGTLSEEEFARLVTQWKAEPGKREWLAALLRENHPVYDERGTAATVRMRGWILAAFAEAGLPGSALPYALEELDNGRDAYLVAAAARGLRGYHQPSAVFAPFLVRALTNIRSHDDIVTFEGYGGYADSSAGITATQEVLTTLGWLGTLGRVAAGDLELMLEPGERKHFSSAVRKQIARTLTAILAEDPRAASETDCCAIPGIDGFFEWPRRARRTPVSIDSTMFEDQQGNSIRFGEFLRGKPSVVVFFYTRCDNPRKCSLTIAKLGRVQRLLAERGLADRVRTAAITYDPAWDLPARMRGYGESRDLRMDRDNRMLRSMDGLPALRQYFRLGVNFVESLVNRHRIELFILDADCRVAAGFERIQWSERQVADRVAQILGEASERPVERASRSPGPGREWTAALLPVVSVATALLPKCPVCWAAYLSLLGVAGLEHLLDRSWVLPGLIGLMALNLASLWLRGRSRGRRLGFYLGAVGAVAILVLGLGFDLPYARPAGVALTLVGSVLGVAGSRDRGPTNGGARGRRLRSVAVVPETRAHVGLGEQAKLTSSYGKITENSRSLPRLVSCSGWGSHCRTRPQPTRVPPPGGHHVRA